MLNLEKSEFLSDAQIKEQAPCVFSKKASVDESTPPDIAIATFVSFGCLNSPSEFVFCTEMFIK